MSTPSQVLLANAASAMQQAQQGTNCYWYGAVRYPNEPHVPKQDPCGCDSGVPPMDGALLGWPDAGLTPMIGTSSAGYVAMTDCSGFVSYVLHGVSDAAYAGLLPLIDALKKSGTDVGNYLKGVDAKGQGLWPTAADYACVGWADAARPFFTTIVGRDQPDLGQAQPGDILAYGVPSGDDTGHVVFVEECAPFNGSYWPVTVIDSTRYLHESDSRAPNGTGVGRGILGFARQGDAWTVSFEPQAGSKHFHPIDYLSVLRLQ